jgi:hypothetical protein
MHDWDVLIETRDPTFFELSTAQNPSRTSEIAFLMLVTQNLS